MHIRCRVTLLGELAVELAPDSCGAATFARGTAGPPAARRRVVRNFGTRKTAALLAFLAFHPDRSHPRELLAELLWPEEDPTATRVRLRTALVALRHILEPEGAASPRVLITDRLTAQLDPQLVVTDVGLFEAALQQVGAAKSPRERLTLLGEAVALYEGELLPGFYEEWVLPERERLADAYVSALTQHADLLAGAGETEAAIRQARRAAAADPLREDSQLRLMRFYACAGRPSDALRQYRQFERALKQELNRCPCEEMRTLARAIETGGIESPLPHHQAPAALGAGRMPAFPGLGAGAEAGRMPAFPGLGAEAGRMPAFPGPDRPRLAPVSGLEPEGGAVPLDSPFYIERLADAAFHDAILRQDSIVLLQGPRQAGRTSLLARGLQRARAASAAVVLTDFQKITAEQLCSTDSLFRAVAEGMAEELELDVSVAEFWAPERGWSVNFERFLRREVLRKLGVPVVWGLDEVDRLLAYPYASEVFGLFRSWHNERALRPSAPWHQFTLAIAYATEVHLFITDLNQSLFNVGTRLELEDFSRDQVEELNRRHGSPLKTPAEVARFVALIGGHPYLVRRGLHRMVADGLTCTDLEGRAPLEHGPFGGHLRRLNHSLSHDPDLRAAVRHGLEHGTCPTDESFARLRSAGVFLGDTPDAVRPRCHLYRLYLQAHLR